ncbi:MAG: N-acetyl-gamma-glutamyl-phosphate reductase [Rickettsiales bacterium]|jgi:N-acetyl-gamma-glutamyl-phosphate reductase|nr:N-acetyl-gamma-glutamyl-phosphate reductase [Rickettsiales bacterium]
MKKINVFVDGHEGTTGLQINERLESRKDVEVIKISSDLRKNLDARKACINSADVVFLCLPDDAAKEAAALVENDKTIIIDASTAHRTDSNWTYGLPEISPEQRDCISKSKRIANPGCHATGFISAIYPLVKKGIIPAEYPLTCHSITGYSGGGKKLIEKFQNKCGLGYELVSPQIYSTTLQHKHIPEMMKVCGLKYAPVFTPIVANFERGMSVVIPLAIRLFNRKIFAKDICDFLGSYYANEEFIKIMPMEEGVCLNNGFLGAQACNGTNRLELCVSGHSEQALIVARLDNLGKGASGAAIQNMNIALGLRQAAGLTR